MSENIGPNLKIHANGSNIAFASTLHTGQKYAQNSENGFLLLVIYFSELRANVRKNRTKLENSRQWFNIAFASTLHTGQE